MHKNHIPGKMGAMVLEAPGTPMQMMHYTTPHPGPEKVLLKILACVICRTDRYIY